MSRGSKVFRPTDLPESNSSGYPAPFRDAQRKRWNRRLGDHGGLKNYGVNFVRVEPGGQSYPDIDLELKAGPDGERKFRHKDGSPYPKIEPT